MSYDDIIHLPHHVSSSRPQMPLIDRAAQFAPFAALVGHDAAIKETARLTDRRIELDDDTKLALSDRLQVIAEHSDEPPEVSITYFRPDAKKEGGAYVAVTGTVKKIDKFERLVTMSDGTAVPIDEIIGIDGRIFEALGMDE